MQFYFYRHDRFIKESIHAEAICEVNSQDSKPPDDKTFKFG